MEEVSLPKLISASNILGRGFGDKRLTLVLDELPDILTSDETISEKEKSVGVKRHGKENSRTVCK